MVSKKGIVLTAGILVAITLGSFVVWYIPTDSPAARTGGQGQELDEGEALQGSQMRLTVSDYEKYLDGVREIHDVIDSDLDEAFQMMLDGSLEPEEYAEIAETSSSQINSQIIQLVESKPAAEWVDSYAAYMEALRSFNSEIRETIVYARLLEDSALMSSLEGVAERMAAFASATDRWVAASTAARP